MQFPAVTSELAVEAAQRRWPDAGSQLLLKVPPLAVTPTSNERIVASGDAIRHRGFSAYA
jgi:hypothetical protein